LDTEIKDEQIIVRKPRSSKNYVNGVDLLNSLIEYYKSIDIAAQQGKEPPPIPRYIGECIISIANKLATKINFVMYTYKEELIGDAIEKMVEAVNLKKFDPTLSSNPFAYFSQISWNCFLQRIEKEKREAYVKHKNLQNLNFEDMESLGDLMDNEEHIKVIENFEKPKEKNNYAGHKNLSYSRNRIKKIKLTDNKKDDTI